MCPARNTILSGDCISLMQCLPNGSADSTLIDPPYLVRYHDRQGRTVAKRRKRRLVESCFHRNVPGAEDWTCFRMPGAKTGSVSSAISSFRNPNLLRSDSYATRISNPIWWPRARDSRPIARSPTDCRRTRPVIGCIRRKSRYLRWKG
jgi:site-specific DNA-methyltransferase (adenine-specific)